jgi:hypothetical protein
MGPLRISGFAAWLIWSTAHIFFLIGFRNRQSVALNWSWNYLTFQRGARLITGVSGSRMETWAPIARPVSEPAPSDSAHLSIRLVGLEMSLRSPLVTLWAKTAEF